MKKRSLLLAVLLLLTFVLGACGSGNPFEGTVENSVLFRGVEVGKGAVVKNCILMQDTVVEAGANLEYLITDKNVKISAGKEVKGADSYPLYIAKNHTV